MLATVAPTRSARAPAAAPQRSVAPASPAADYPTLAPSAPVVRRAPGTGPGWSGSAGINAGASTVGAIRRIPVDGLNVGLQKSRKPSGRAIVLVPAGFDPHKPADVLLHFHGHNAGYAETGGAVRDEQQDRIEAQIEASGRPQLLAILPQGDVNSSFGTSSGQKALSTDDVINAVLATLEAIKAVTPRPAVASVVLSGHSGAGELINEKLLGGSPSSALPQTVGTLKEVALFDAVNGPHEFTALQGFLKAKLAAESAALAALTDQKEQLAFLRTSFRFRSYFSHSKDTGDYYRRWHVGPLPPGHFSDPRPLGQMLDEFFASAAGRLDPAVAAAFKTNYRIVDAGSAVEHDKIVGDSDHLTDALRVLPKHDDAVGASPEVAPPAVHETLRRPGRELAAADRVWAQTRFQRSFASVRIHDDDAAARSAQALRAHAYTVGRDIVFAPGRYRPEDARSRGLLAHELSHVVQQDGFASSVSPLPAVLPVGRPDDPLERDAERAEASATNAAAHNAGIRVQRAPDSKTVAAVVCETNANPHPAKLGECSCKEPKHCPTYEAWISTFALLNTFDAKDTPGTHGTGGKVIGDGPADVDFRPASTPPKPPVPHTTPLKPGERFIDHPTNTWVEKCLPENLRATAYQLPADCADVAMILRHVWLAAHSRTETFGRWTLGSGAGRAEEGPTLAMISAEGTGSVAGIIAPYADPTTGAPLRSFAALAPLLHPGDILVWWHFDNGFDKPRTGGHTHTIAGVSREPSGKLIGLTLLQGNEPLFQGQKDDIHAKLAAEKPKAAQPTDAELGSAPGRRIERMTSSESRLDLSAASDMDVADGKKTIRVWKWGRETLLQAAGPPKSGGQRPSVQRAKGETGPVPRRLTDWIPVFANAPLDRFAGVLDGMLYELRATIEGGAALAEADVRATGAAAGADLWKRAKAAGGLGNVAHFAPLQNALDTIAAFAASRGGPKSNDLTAVYDVITERLQRHLRWLREAFETAARGISEIDFGRGKPGTSAVNVLLTGFDPFTDATLQRPGPEQWNPSGAAVLALDNARLPVADSKGRKGTAAVEGVVLPVSFDAFNTGIVEQAVGPHAKELDAVLTVSMDGRRGPNASVRLERYAVGVHEIGGTMQGVSAAPGGLPGPVVIETKAPLDAIADAQARPAGKNPRLQPAFARPDIGEDFTFAFATPDAAKAAQRTLGGTFVSPASLALSDSTVVHEVASTMARIGNGAQVRFRAKNADFTATLVEGPGGNFLSNEVAFRAQRALGTSGAQPDPLAFHVHTPSAVASPVAASRPALAQREELIGTMKRLIGVVAKIILDKRSGAP